VGRLNEWGARMSESGGVEGGGNVEKANVMKLQMDGCNYAAILR
jgi:hypothetical protein